jgi:hypothetical protein
VFYILLTEISKNLSKNRVNFWITVFFFSHLFPSGVKADIRGKIFVIPVPVVETHPSLKEFSINL